MTAKIGVVCAGMVLLAKECAGEVARTCTTQPLLGLVDVKVRRNAFGRQIDSFHPELTGDRRIHHYFLELL